MSDILFQRDNQLFSYRVAGICMQNRQVLLQRPEHDPGYAFPGGHVAFGETNEETLAREFKEELGAQIIVGDLKWVAEIFFPWTAAPASRYACITRSSFALRCPAPAVLGAPKP